MNAGNAANKMEQQDSIIEKLSLESKNLTEEQRLKLKELFPEVFTEGLKIDFDRLKAVLGETIDVDKERYGLNWPGKLNCFKAIQTPSSATLRPVPEESVNWESTENMIIEGDNLEVLKLLQKGYAGKVKMIYIDPPYNTGNDFIYPDNYIESLETYLKYTGQVDEDGLKISANLETDGRFHSKWLNMMYPRLSLARNLLKEDGVIFISIDDGEVDNLKKICNEVFGEENFIACFLWKKKGTTTNVRGVSVSSLTEYVICYGRSDNSINNREVTPDMRIFPFKDEIGIFRTSIIEKKNSGSYERRTMQFQILGHFPREGKRWQIGEKKAAQYEKENRFLIEDNIVKLKIYEFEDKITSSAQPNILFEHGSYDSASKAVNNILFGIPEFFSNPKPIELIKQLTLFSDSDLDEDIILDFFAGSGTTAHAVLDLNKQDNGNRKFILVQLPEPTTTKKADGTIEESQAYKAGYKTIADITKERVRRVIKKLNEEENPSQTSLPLETDIKPQDRGFRVFKLDTSNFKLWDSDSIKDQEKLTQALFEFSSQLKKGRTDEDVLFELILKSGLPINTKIETKSLAGEKVYCIEDSSLVITLAKAVSKELAQKIAELKPVRVVFLDSGFNNNDQLKKNILLTLKEANADVVIRCV